MEHSATWLQYSVLGLVVTGVVGSVLISYYRGNRLLFWCVVGTFFAHMLFAGSLWAVGKLLESRPVDRQVEIVIAAPPPPKVEEPKPEPEVHQLDLPLGRPDGKRDVTKIKKGTTLNPNAREGQKGDKTFGNQRTIASPTAGPGDVGYDPDATGYDIFGPGDSMDPRDLYAVGKPGGGGQDWGVPDGDPNGGVPAGFANGKIGGRVYFVRLKYGSSSAWFAYNDGTQRLLAYLNKTFPCQSDTWPMTTAELKKKYLNKGQQPTFLYAYCDDGFVLSGEDVLVLREYMNKGGFLFLDSRPDTYTKDVVARELDKVLPGQRLAPIANSHPINSFLYRLTNPGVGLNVIEKKNYGITKGGRLVVFLSMGNLANFYNTFTPESDQYATAQYQMGANVMLYAITKGNDAGFTKKAGARAEVTTQALEKLGFLKPEGDTAPTLQPGESVKVKRDPPTDAGTPGAGTPGQGGTGDPPPPDDPDEIKLLD